MNLEEKIKSVIRTIPDFPKQGIMFKDITPLFYDQALCNEIVEGFIRKLKGIKLDAIVGIESRGFLFGFLLANKLNIPFVLVRKSGKLPYLTVSHEYYLEYGTAKIEMHTDALKEGWNVLVHDDLLATGGTADATAHLIKKMKAKVAGFSFLVELEFLEGRERIKNHSNNIQCLVNY
ncbi:MAG: adenine phosphoribosyltransferase [Bacteroidota bacterium]|jgi:adenine phosphoribosyltransferase